MSRSSPPLFLLLFLLFLVPPGRSHAAPKAPAVGAVPPQPVEMNLKVHREGKTEIPLRIYGKANEPLTYLIRVTTEHGKLSEPRQIDRENAVIIYEPTSDLSITTDKFTYAVQSNAGVSAGVQVALTIVDTPPQLVIQDSIDFSKIRTGSSNYRMLEISNHGGLFATGEVIPDAPWKIEGKTGYRLGAGEVAVFKVFFRPDESRKYEGVVRYTSDREHSSTLRGEAEAAIFVDPAEWTLQQMPGDPARSASFELTSQLDAPATVRLKTDRRLKVPAEIQFAPRGKATVTVEAEPTDVRNWDTEIRLEGADFSIAIPVHVPSLAAVVRANTPTVAFGRLAVGKNGVAQFELENIGGALAPVSWEISPPFRRPESSAVLLPGEKRSFSLEIETKATGRYRTWLEFTSGQQKFDIPVQAEVVSAQSVARPNPDAIPGGASPEENTTPPPPGLPTTPAIDVPPAFPPEWQADLRLPAGVHVSNITPTSAVIEWPVKLSAATQFRVEMKQFRVGPDQKLTVTWLQPTGIPIAAHGANYTAVLTGLLSNQPWSVRIMALENNGEAPTRLFALDFLTPPKPTLWARLPRITFFRTLVVLGVGILAYVGWRRRKQPGIA